MNEVITGLLGSLGLGGLLLGSIIEALGFPFPGAIMVVFAGILVNRGELDFVGSLVSAVAGFNVGAFAAYLLGRRVGEPFLYTMGKYLKITPEKLEKARRWMEQSSAAFIIFGRFVPMVSNLTPYMAGISRLEPGRFFLYNTIFATMWASFNLAVGIFFSRNWQTFLEYTQSRLPFLAAAGILLYIAIGLILRRRIRS